MACQVSSANSTSGQSHTLVLGNNGEALPNWHHNGEWQLWMLMAAMDVNGCMVNGCIHNGQGMVNGDV